MERILLTLFLLTSLNVSAQLSSEIAKNFEKHHTSFQSEKIYLHLNKPHYRLGETIYFQAYLANALDHRNSTVSDVVRVELISPSGQVLAERLLSQSHDRMSGDFELDVSYDPGPYTIRAFTNWMRNFPDNYFFTQTFNVFEGNGLKTFEKSNNEQKEIDLKFFPEGGDLINGLESSVAIKVVDRSGRGIKVQGIVTNSFNEKVASFESNELGFAQFKLTAVEGQQYKAQITTSNNDYEFTLQDALESGYSLNVENDFDLDKIKINIAAMNLELLNSSVLIHKRGEIIKSIKIEESVSTFSMDLEKTDLKPGVFHLTVFDPVNRPVAERLFAVNLRHNSTDIELRTDSIYLIGQEPEIEFALSDAFSGTSSVSIVKENGYHLTSDLNIRNYFLLASDLVGPIEKPSNYFRNTREAHENLDLLMLTQGWKRFEWNEILSDRPKSIDYEAESNGINYSGLMVDFFNRKKPREGVVKMSMMGSNIANEVTTDSQGNFEIKDVNFRDSIELIFSASRKVNKKGKMKADAFIEFNSDYSPPMQEISLLSDLSSNINDLTEIDTSDLTILEEIVVSAKKEVAEQKDPFEKARTLYLKPSIRIVADSVLKKRVGVKSVAGFLRGIPGVAIIGTGPGTMVRLQGLGSQKRIVATNENMAPLYLIDGVPTSETSVFSLNQFDVYYIDVLRGTEASLYGTRGSNGVIAIFMRPAELAKAVPRPGSLFVQFPGYYKAKKFEFNDVMKSNLAIDPLGVAVHWDPKVMISNGVGRFQFKLPDEPGNYHIRIEGMTDDGSPIFAEESIQVD